MPNLTKTELRHYLASSGREQFTDDIYSLNQFQEVIDSGDLKDDVAANAAGFNLELDLNNPGSVTNRVNQFIKDNTPESPSALDALRSSTGMSGSDHDFSQLLKPKMQKTGDFTGVLGREEEEEGNYVFNALERGLTNDIGFMQATAGLAADAVGAESMAKWLKERAQVNFEKADAIEASESTLGWAGELILEQIPSMVLTLGTGWLVKAGAKATIGSAAKAAVREGMERSVAKGMVGKGLSQEAATEFAKGVAKSDVVDGVAQVGLRDAFLAKGREAYQRTAIDKLKKAGVVIDKDLAGDALTKGMRRRFIAETAAPYIGAAVASYGMTTGDIIRDLEKAAEELGQEGPSFGDVAFGGALASALDLFPAVGLAKKFGILESGGLLTKIMVDAAKDPKARSMVQKLGKEIAKGSVSEGATEAMQGMVAEGTKKFFIDQFPKMTEDQQMSLGQYLFREEAWVRYGQEFLGGAVVGGAMRGAATGVEGYRQKKLDSELDARITEESERKAAAQAKADKAAEEVRQEKIRKFTEENIQPLTLLELPAAGESSASQMEQKPFLSRTESFGKEAFGRATSEQAERSEVTYSPRTEGRLKELDDELKEINALVESNQITIEEAQPGYDDIKQRKSKIMEDLTEDELLSEVDRVNNLATKNKALKLAKLAPLVASLKARGLNPDGTPIGQETEATAAVEQEADTEATAPVEQEADAALMDEFKELQKVNPTEAAVDMTLKHKEETPKAVMATLTDEQVDTMVEFGEIDQELADTIKNVKQEATTPVAQETEATAPVAQETDAALMDEFKELERANPSEAAVDMTIKHKEKTPKSVMTRLTDDQVDTMVEFGEIDQGLADTIKQAKQEVTPKATTTKTPAKDAEALTELGFSEQDMSLLHPTHKKTIIKEGLTKEDWGDVIEGIRAEKKAAKPLEWALEKPTSQFTDSEKTKLRNFDNTYFGGSLFAQAMENGESDPFRYIKDEIAADLDVFNASESGPSKFSKVRSFLKQGTKERASINVKTATIDRLKKLSDAQLARLSNSQLETLDTRLQEDAEARKAERQEADAAVSDQAAAEKKTKTPTVEDGVKFDERIKPRSDSLVASDFSTIPQLGELPVTEAVRQETIDDILKVRASLDQAMKAHPHALPGSAAHNTQTALRDEYVRQLDNYATTMGIDIAMGVEDAINEQKTKGVKNPEVPQTLSNTVRSAAITHLIQTDRKRAENIIGSDLVQEIRSKSGPQWSKPDPSTGGRMTVDGMIGWLDTETPGFLANTEIVVTNTEKFTQETGIAGDGVWDGAYHNGKIYLNADVVTDETIERVLFHEGLGHAMAKQVLGDVQYKATMDTIIRELNSLKSKGKDAVIGDTTVSSLLERYKELRNPDGSYSLEVAEEIWAKYIDAHAANLLNDRSSVLMKVYDAIRKFVRKAMGLEENLTDVNARAADIVRKARLNLIDPATGRIKDVDTSGVKFSKPTPIPNANEVVRIMGIAMPKFINKTFLADFGSISSNKDDIGVLKRMMFMPQWIAEQGAKVDAPLAQRKLYEMWKEMTNISDHSVEIQGRHLNTLSPFFKAKPEDARAIEKVLVKGDWDGVVYKSAQEANLTPAQFESYQAVRITMDNIRDEMVKDAELTIKMLEKQRDTVQESGARAFIDDHIKEIRKGIKGLKEAKGYIPRVRKEGSWSISYVDKTGQRVFKTIEGGRVAGKFKADEMKRQLETQGALNVQVSERPTKVYDAMENVSTQEITNLVASLMKDKDGNLPDGLVDMMKNALYVRGFQKHYIKRVKTGDRTENEEGQQIKGYEEENLGEHFVQYVSNFARHSSRREFSKRLGDIFESKDENGRLVFDPQSPNTGVYKMATQFLKTAHKGMDSYDRFVKTANSMAYHAWIGGRVSSAIWNMTHVHMFGASLLHNESKKRGLKKVGLKDMSLNMLKSHKDAIKFMSKAKDKELGQPVTMADMGWSTPQQRKDLEVLNKYHEISKAQTMASQTYENMIENDSNIGKRALHKYKKVAGTMMHVTEVSNRLSTMLSHFREFDNYDDAKLFVRKLNGSYENFNLPGWLQGEGLMKSGAQSLLYTFGTHVQNTSQILWDLGANKNGAALGYGLLAASLIGGVPGREMLEKFGQMMFGESLEQWTTDTFGKSVSKAMRSGVVFPMLGVDAGNSLALGAPPIANAANLLLGKGEEHAVIAPITGMIKAMKGEQPPHKAIPFKAIQSIFQAFNEGERVQVGRKQILNSDGTAMQLTPWEQILTAIGLVPTRKSEASNQQWNDSQIRRWWNDYKSKVVSYMKEARTPSERREANKMMREFNKDLMEIRRNKAYRDIIKNRGISWADTRRERGTTTLRDS